MISMTQQLYMFDFLKQLTHNHAPPQSQNPPLQSSQLHSINESSVSEDQNRSLSPKGQLNTVILPRKQTKKIVRQQKKPKKTTSITAKMQEATKIQLNPKVKAKFGSLLSESQSGLSSILKNNMDKIKQDIEKKVYIRQMSRCQDEYLEQVGNAVKFQNYFISQGISSTITGVIDQIANDIEKEAFEPRLKRKRFLENSEERKIEALKIIKMQESQLQDKIGELRVELNQQDLLEKRAKEITDKDQYNTQNVKTKLAEEFVKQLQKQKQEKRIKMQEMKERKREMELQLKEEQKIMEQKVKEERHLKLMEQFIEKQKAKQQREELARSEQLNFQSFLKEYKATKPLYKKKEQQFEKAQKMERKQRFNTLKQNQARYEPLDLDTLDVHEEKYIQLKREDRERKSAELVLSKHEEKMRKKELDQKVYKGRFRYLILQEMMEAQIKKKEKEDQKKAILAKKHAYSLEVKERFKPEIDPSKRIQIEQIVNAHKGRKRKYMTPNRVSYSERNSTIGSRPVLSDTGSEPDPKQEGKRYHRLFKQYLKDKIDRGEIRESTQRTIETIQPKAPNYLQQLREKYSDRIPSKSKRLDHEIQKLSLGDDYRGLILKAQQFENRAKLRQKKIRYAPHKPQEEAQLQEEYLCAIKAKMELINHID